MTARGLANLGNTCYLNSTVQVLAHTRPLKALFNDPDATYKSQINYATKISEGKVAEAFGALATQMWSKGNNSPRLKDLAPSNFRGVLGKIDSRWRGIEQHDAHEFFLFLINSIHDDLNRVKQRPTIPERDDVAWAKLSDNEQAKLIWETEKSISDSPVSDSFRGLFKSTLKCPICHNQSVKFDPFFDISTPLPSKSFISFSVALINLAEAAPHKEIRITMKTAHSIGDLKAEIAKAIGLGEQKKSSLLLAHVFEDEFVHFFLDDAASISTISAHNEIYCYPLTSDPSVPSLTTITLPVVQRVSGPKLTDDRKGFVSVPRAVSFPFIVTLPRQMTYGQLRDFVLRHSSKLVQISASEKDGDLPPLTLANSFGLSKGSYKDRNPKPLIQTDSSIVTFNPGEVLSIDWCPQGLAQERFSRKRPEEIIEVAPDGVDAASELSLADCLKAFMHEEKLSVEEAWYCPTCKEHRQAVKKFDLWALPEILVIHLNRFESHGFWAGKKINKLVRFPVDGLDMSEFIPQASAWRPDGPLLYDLVGNHVGALAIMGHYTAFVRGDNGKWLNYDDETVSELKSAEEVVTPRAYVLVYKRRS